MRLVLRRKRTLSSDIIESFCNNILYYDKLIDPRSCYREFFVRFDNGSEVFKSNGYYDALSFIIQNLEIIKRRKISYLSIRMSIGCSRFDNFDFFMLNGLDVEEVKNEISNKADDREIYFSSDMSRVYGEYFDIHHLNYAFDYDLLYNKDIRIPDVNRVYISNIEHGKKNCYSYLGKVMDLSITKPYLVTNIDFERMSNRIFEHKPKQFGYTFGVEGLYQHEPYKNGMIEDWESEYPYFVPICTLVEAKDDRPKIKNVNRYKITIRFPNYWKNEELDIASAYIDTDPKDIEKAKEIVKDYGNWSCYNIEDIEVLKVEQVPDGKWII